MSLSLRRKVLSIMTCLVGYLDMSEIQVGLCCSADRKKERGGGEEEEEEEKKGMKGGDVMSPRSS